MKIWMRSWHCHRKNCLEIRVECLRYAANIIGRHQNVSCDCLIMIIPKLIDLDSCLQYISLDDFFFGKTSHLILMPLYTGNRHSMTPMDKNLRSWTSRLHTQPHFYLANVRHSKHQPKVEYALLTSLCQCHIIVRSFYHFTLYL